jgi:type I restriction enzyme, S subunit
MFKLDRPNKVHPVLSAAVGSTGQTELSRERIASTQIVIPPADLQTRFCHAIAPMNNMLVCCMRRNGNLRATRDLLLPKLVSGDVSVEVMATLEKEAATV